jgi:hypothetical protein
MLQAQVNPAPKVRKSRFKGSATAGDLWREGDSIRYTRSKDKRTVYCHALDWPGNSLRLTTVKRTTGSRITMFGYPEPVRWKYDSDDQSARIYGRSVTPSHAVRLGLDHADEPVNSFSQKVLGLAFFPKDASQRTSTNPPVDGTFNALDVRSFNFSTGEGVNLPHLCIIGLNLEAPSKFARPMCRILQISRDSDREPPG